MTFGNSRTAHLPSMDSVKNSREYEPALSPCGSMDQLLHLSTEEQAMDVESINTSGEINESLLFLDEDDIKEESSDYNTLHGSTKSKDGRAKNSLKDEKHAKVSRISIKEEKFSTTPEFTAQDSTISKGIWNPIKIKKEPGAENERDCSSKSLDCSNTHDMVMVNFEDEDAREIKVEPILENTGSAESLHISAVEGYVEQECNEKPVDAVAVERLADKGGDSANTELGAGVNAAAVDLANSGVGASIPEDSNLIVLTRQQLELYVMLRMRQCLVAEHNAQKLPFEKKYCALQRSLVRWRCRALQLKQQLQDLISADNRQAGLHRRPQQRSVGMLVRLPSPERQQPPLPPSPPAEPMVTIEAPSVTMAMQLVSAPPPVTMATPPSMLQHPSPHFIEPVVPTVVAHSALLANLRLPAPRSRAAADNTAQVATEIPTGMLARLPPAKHQFSSAGATPPIPTSAVPVSMAMPPVPAVAIPVNMAAPSVFMPSVPGNAGAPLVLMAVPSGAMKQPASPHFFNPTMGVASGSGDSQTSPPMKMLCVPQQVVAAASAAMQTAEGAVGMLVQLPCASQQQPSHAPVVAGPPVVPAVAGSPFATAMQPAATETPPVATATSVSSSRSTSSHFFHPSMAARPSFTASQTSSLSSTQQPVVTTANATTMTTTNTTLPTSKPEAIRVTIDTTNRGTSLPHETGCVGGTVRRAPSELQKLASASTVATPPVPKPAAPVVMATSASSSPHAPPPSCKPSVAATNTGSNCELLRKLLLQDENKTPFGSTTLPGGVSGKPVPAPSCAATRVASLSANDVIDLTLDEEAESTPVRVIPGTGTGSSVTTSRMQQLSVPFAPTLKMALTSNTQVPNLSSQPDPTTRASIPSSSELNSPNAVWHSAGKVAQPGLPLPAQVKYYMPKCVVVTSWVPDVQPAASDSSQQPAPPIGSPTVMVGGGLESACPGSPTGPSATDSTSTVANETRPRPEVSEDASFPLPSIRSHLVTNVTWSGSLQYSSAGAVMQNCSLPSPPTTTNSLSNVASQCVPTLEVGEVDAPIFAAAEANACEAEHRKRTAADRMRDCRLRKKLATASPVKKVPKSGAQRIREFRERLKANLIADNGNMDQQVRELKLSSESDHADSELNEKVEEDDLDLILICDSGSCPSSPAGEENNVELLASDAES